MMCRQSPAGHKRKKGRAAKRKTCERAKELVRDGAKGNLSVRPVNAGIREIEVLVC